MRHAFVLSLCIVLAGCGSCSKNDEPKRDPKYNPTPDAAALTPKPTASAAPSSTLTPIERRDMRVRIGNEQCENAAKVVNKLNNRAETDPKGINLLGLCLTYGNNAWYRCVLGAKSAEAANQCTVRFLAPPDETAR